MNNNDFTALALDTLATVTGGNSDAPQVLDPAMSAALWKQLGKAGPSSTPRSLSYPAGTVVCNNKNGKAACDRIDAK